MQWLQFGILIIISAIIQASLAGAKYKPDLLLILMVFFAIYAGRNQAIITSFAAGLAFDLVGFAIGPGIISFGILGAFLCNLTRVITIRRMPYQAITIFLMGLCSGFSIYLLNRIKGQPSNPDIKTIIFWTSLLSAVLGPFLFIPFGWLTRLNTSGHKRT
jgi:rod shape-determining protein MreD